MKSRIAILAAGLVLAMVVLTGCASSTSIPTNWFRSTSLGAVYVTWTDTTSGIKGTVQDAILPSKPQKPRLVTARYSFVGTISKGKIVLHLVDGKFKETDHGTVTAKTLVIDNGASTVLHPGTGQQYVDAVAKLKQKVAAG